MKLESTLFPNNKNIQVSYFTKQPSKQYQQKTKRWKFFEHSKKFSFSHNITQKHSTDKKTDS